SSSRSIRTGFSTRTGGRAGSDASRSCRGRRLSHDRQRMSLALYCTGAIEGRAHSMPKPVPLPPPGFDELSVDEKLDYLQSLWDRIAATPETVPLPEWPREILDQRLKDRRRTVPPL